MAVHDRLRQAGRAGGEEDVERVCERHRVELERPRLAHELVPRDRPGDRAAGVLDVDDRLQRRQPLADRGDVLAAVDELLSVDVPADREQHLRVELAQPVDDAADAELRRARRPDCAEARRREERDRRLRDVRKVGDDAVAGADSEPFQAGARPCHLLAELAERELARLAGLGVGEDRGGVEILVAAEHVLGVVQRRAREPLRARHLARAEHPLVRGVRADSEVVPDRGPEALEVGHRPAPELVVAREVEPALGAQPLDVAAHLEPLAPVRRRRPDGLSLHHAAMPRRRGSRPDRGQGGRRASWRAP